MEFKDLFEKFNNDGKLLLPDTSIIFADIELSKHPTFEGVELKHIITAQQTHGQFSFHLVRIAPGKKIGMHGLMHSELLKIMKFAQSSLALRLVPAQYCLTGNDYLQIPWQ